MKLVNYLKAELPQTTNVDVAQNSEDETKHFLILHQKEGKAKFMPLSKENWQAESIDDYSVNITDDGVAIATTKAGANILDSFSLA